MKHQITMETAIIIAKYSISPLSCWPPAAGSSRLAVSRYNIFVSIGFVHLIATIASSLYNIYLNSHNPSKMIKVFSEMGTTTAAAVKMIIWKIETPRIEVLIDELKTFLEQATREEEELMQSYVDKFLVPHAVVFVSSLIGTIAFISAPMVTSQPLPGDAAHPFRTDTFWVWAFLYVSQSFVIIQIGCIVYVDIFCATLLWYAGARFKMLAMELESARNDADVHRCVRKHQRLIEFVDKLKGSIHIIAVAVVATTLITVSTGGFILIQRPPAHEVAKYVCYELATAMELFLFTWPADNLIDAVSICKKHIGDKDGNALLFNIEKSMKIGDAAYGCDWIGKSPGMLKDLLIIIERSQFPIYIAVDGLLPILSLEFYGSTLMTTVSYLTALRAFAAD